MYLAPLALISLVIENDTVCAVLLPQPISFGVAILRIKTWMRGVLAMGCNIYNVQSFRIFRSTTAMGRAVLAKGSGFARLDYSNPIGTTVWSEPFYCGRFSDGETLTYGDYSCKFGHGISLV